MHTHMLSRWGRYVYKMGQRTRNHNLHSFAFVDLGTAHCMK